MGACGILAVSLLLTHLSLSDCHTKEQTSIITTAQSEPSVDNKPDIPLKPKERLTKARKQHHFLRYCGRFFRYHRATSPTRYELLRLYKFARLQGFKPHEIDTACELDPDEGDLYDFFDIVLKPEIENKNIEAIAIAYLLAGTECVESPTGINQSCSERYRLDEDYPEFGSYRAYCLKQNLYAYNACVIDVLDDFGLSGEEIVKSYLIEHPQKIRDLANQARESNDSDLWSQLEYELEYMVHEPALNLAFIEQYMNWKDSALSLEMVIPLQQHMRREIAAAAEHERGSLERREQRLLYYWSLQYAIFSNSAEEPPDWQN